MSPQEIASLLLGNTAEERVMAGAGTTAKTDTLLLQLSKWAGDLYTPHPAPLIELKTNSAKVVSGQRALPIYHAGLKSHEVGIPTYRSLNG